MTDRISFLRPTGIALAALMLAGAVHAQAPAPAARAAAAPSSSPSAARTADYIVALVNSEPVTNSEIRRRAQRVAQQLAQRGGPQPTRDQLLAEVLELVITERAQMQHAAEIGIRVSENDIDEAEKAVAAQNQLSRDEFRRRLVRDAGTDVAQFRADLKRELTLQRLQDREVVNKVTVSEADIDNHLREQRPASNPDALELNLGHILIAVPEGASEAQVQALKAKADEAARRARAGEDIGVLARELSDAPERSRGGVFGMRPASRLPELFVSGVKDLPVGGIAGPLRSGAGFHVLKVVEKRTGGVDATITQTRARHILLRPSSQLSQTQAIERLNTWRQQILAGQARFEDLAREHSTDGSAPGGGDLGWASPGQFVPEFEQAMDALKPGELSPPVVSRFGVHLIRVDERRQQALSQRDQREVVRNIVREKKAAEALDLWARDIRARAYVEIREEPQL